MTKNNPYIKRGKKLIESFTGEKAEIYGRVKLPPPPKIGLVIGRLVGVIYEADREKVNYIHRFRKTSRPLLVTSHDGKQLYMIGGSYNFTDRGIVDKSPKRKR